MIAYAATGKEIAQTFVAKFNTIILFPLITLMTAVALMVFLWGCFEFIMGANNETARAQGKQHILYGIIGLLIMVAAYAILNLAAGTFGLSIPK